MEPILAIICLSLLAYKIKDEQEREAQLKVVRVASHVNIRGRQAELRLARLNHYRVKKSLKFTRLHMDSSAKTISSARKW